MRITKQIELHFKHTMAAVSNPTPQAVPESKTAKKKKAKAEVIARDSNVQCDGETSNGHGPHDPTLNGVDGAYESPYLKELYKYAKPLT